MEYGPHTLDVLIEEIELGEILVEDAQPVIGAMLEDLDEDKALEVYSVLRAWMWKTLNGRRRDEELPEWLDLMKGTSAIIEKAHPAVAARIDALGELLDESISAGEVSSSIDVASLEPVRKILTIIDRHPDAEASRSLLIERMRTTPNNLGRLLGMMMSARLIEQKIFGADPVYTLSWDGREALRTKGAVPDGQDRKLEYVSNLIVGPR